MRSGDSRKPQFDAQAAADLVKSLAHPMRLQILYRLLDGELSVGGFESELGLKQPSLSQQLALLRDARLVETRREAKSVFYRLTDDRVRIVLDTLQKVQGAAPKTIPITRAPVTRTPVTHAPKRPSARPVADRPQAAAGCGMFAIAGWPSSGGRP
jgi:DNA-binding transcriptional ArsR family regulator